LFSRWEWRCCPNLFAASASGGGVPSPDRGGHSKTHLRWCKERFSKPLQRYINMVRDRFEGKHGQKLAGLPASHPEKKLAKEGIIKELVA
jgi:hypothetical protein